MPTSTINRTVPANDAPIASSVVRNNFAAAADDVDALWAAISLLQPNNLRVVTASGDVTIASTDRVVIVRKTVPQATDAFLPSSPFTNQFVIILDGSGDADTYNITINGNGYLINGSSTLVIGSPRGWNQLVWDGSQWDIVG